MPTAGLGHQHRHRLQEVPQVAGLDDARRHRLTGQPRDPPGQLGGFSTRSALHIGLGGQLFHRLAELLTRLLDLLPQLGLISRPFLNWGLRVSFHRALRCDGLNALAEG